MRGSRNKLSEAVICALLRDFSKHGEKAIAKVRRTQPAVAREISFPVAAMAIVLTLAPRFGGEKGATALLLLAAEAVLAQTWLRVLP